MALVPDNVINAYKSVVDIASLPAEASRYALANIGLQNKCLFEVIIYPEVFPTSIAGIAFAATYAIIDVLFKIPLTKVTFVVITVLISATSWFFLRSEVVHR